MAQHRDNGPYAPGGTYEPGGVTPYAELNSPPKPATAIACVKQVYSEIYELRSQIHDFANLILGSDNKQITTGLEQATSSLPSAILPELEAFTSKAFDDLAAIRRELHRLRENF